MGKQTVEVLCVVFVVVVGLVPKSVIVAGQWQLEPVYQYNISISLLWHRGDRFLLPCCCLHSFEHIKKETRARGGTLGDILLALRTHR